MSFVPEYSEECSHFLSRWLKCSQIWGKTKLGFNTVKLCDLSGQQLRRLSYPSKFVHQLFIQKREDIRISWLHQAIALLA